LVRLLDENSNKYEVDFMGYETALEHDLDATHDNIICSGAYLKNHESPITFYTDDICLKTIAKKIFNLDVKSARDELKQEDEYLGYKELTDEEIAAFYSKSDEIPCLPNQYIIIKDGERKVKETYKYTQKGFVKVMNKSIDSLIFGDKIKAKDVYQQFAIDSLMTNQITAISGKAGSGKTLLCLSVAMHLIENGKYDRLVVLFNPTKAKGSADMGYYSGSATEKALANSIGNTLTTKFGDRFAIDLLIQQGKLKLVSMADQRGMEISDREILFITECQNTSKELLKLCLTRPSENCKIFIEGDFDSQVDSYSFENENNGMKRAIEVLKGEDIFGYIKLQKVWRSKLAEIVDKM
jgi:predicted ribonuclease YlaK